MQEKMKGSLESKNLSKVRIKGIVSLDMGFHLKIKEAILPEPLLVGV